MNTPRRSATFLAVLCGTALGLSSRALAQASFVQGFDNVGQVQSGQWGPANLIAQGWIFRNQSSPQGFGAWYGATGYSQAGVGCLAVANMANWQNGSSIGSSWMILPAVPNQRAGDPITFWLQDGTIIGGLYGVMEVRYSPSGGTSTGSGPTATGDFSQTLLTIPNVNGRGWTQFSAPLPGTGRIAFRFVNPQASNPSEFTGTFSLDSLVVGAPPALPFPVPNPGQTVHWTTANSPVVINTDLIIPAGGTVVVDPGVQVRIASTVKLHLNGTMQALENTTFTVPTDAQFNINGTASFTGTSAQPVHLTGGPAWFGGDNGYQVKTTGRCSLSHVTLDALVKGAVYIYTTGGSLITASNVAASAPDCGFYVERGTLAMRDCTFSGGATVHVNESYLLIDRTTFTGSQLVSERYRAGQPIFLNHITGTGVTGDAPFVLTGFDHFFGPANTISGNQYAVHLAGAGLARGSTLPLTGNTQSIIPAGVGEVVGRVTFPLIGMDYRIDYPGDENTELGGRLIIDPGVNIRLAPQAYLWSTYSSQILARGLPTRPITFSALNPGQPWQTVDFSVNGNRPIMEHCVFDGSLRALVADETVVRIRECDFTNNQVANRSVNYLYSEIRKSRFLNNQVGVQSAANAAFDANGATMPNVFQGNVSAAESADIYSFQDATHNYWNSPIGPRATSNPSGTGDPANDYVRVIPFRTSPPDFTDSAPVVRLLPASFNNEPGSKILVSWTAEDDHAIVSQRIEWAGHSECLPGLQILAANIPPTARAWEVTIPQYQLSSCIDPAVLRVVAVDNAGQEGIDETMYNVRRADDPAAPIPSTFAGPYRPGESIEVCSTGGSYFDAYLFLDADHWAVSLGGTTTSCLSGTATMPSVSTDLARIGFRTNTTWTFSNYFSIRPDASIGDAPPAVALTAPANNATFPAGSVVPITWSASDDEGLRSFDVHASYDGGVNWHTIAQDLPGTARSFNWQLPPSSGIDDLRLRIVARDLRFQDSSSGADRRFSITAGQACYANCDSSTAAPILNVNDFICFQTHFAAGDAYANCDNSSTPPILNVNDFICFQTRFAAGCP